MTEKVCLFGFSERVKIIMKKHIPNTLSIIRVPSAVLMLLSRNQSWLFFVFFGICGFTDMADGYIARKFHVESALGAKLDGIADNIFAVCAVVSISLVVPFKKLIREIQLQLVFAAIALVVLHRILNMVITKKKFNIWGYMHTIGIKAAGAITSLAIPFCVLMGSRGTLPFPLLYALAGLLELATLEETILIFREKGEYNVDRKGLFFKN